MSDLVLTLYRVYPGAVLRHASGPTGPWNLSRSFSPFIKLSLPGSLISRYSRKQTKPRLSKINNSTLKMKLFLSKSFFLAHFRGFVVWSVHVSKSSYPSIDRTLSVWRIVMSCFRPNESPKFGIVLRSLNRRSRDRRNHVAPESKPNPASPQLHFENEAFFSISYQNVFFSTLSWFRGSVAFGVLCFGLSKFQNLTVHVSIVQLGTVRFSRWRHWIPFWSSLIAEKRGADTELLRRWPRERAVSFPVTPTCTRALRRWSMVYHRLLFSNDPAF